MSKFILATRYDDGFYTVSDHRDRPQRVFDKKVRGWYFKVQDIRVNDDNKHMMINWPNIADTDIFVCWLKENMISEYRITWSYNYGIPYRDLYIQDEQDVTIFKLRWDR